MPHNFRRTYRKRLDKFDFCRFWYFDFENSFFFTTFVPDSGGYGVCTPLISISRSLVEEVEEYTPTVIYTEKKGVNWKIALSVTGVLAAAAVVVAMLNRDKIRDLIASAKDKKANKEDN